MQLNKLIRVLNRTPRMLYISNQIGRSFYITPIGSKYEDDKRHDKGIITFQDGNIYKDNYKDNKKLGNGIYVNPDGSRYEGYFMFFTVISS